MLHARSELEVAGWLLLHEADVQRTVRQEEGEHTRIVHHCQAGPDDPPVTHAFLIPNGTPPDHWGVLTSAEWLALADRMLTAIPRSPAGLIRPVLDACCEELDVALRCCHEAARIRPPLSARANGIRAASAVFRSVRPFAPRPRPLAELPEVLVAARLAPDAAERARTAAPISMEALHGGALGPWGFVGRIQDPVPAALYRHASGAVLQAEVVGDTAVAIQLWEGREALDAQLAHAFRLPASVVRDLDRGLRPGATRPEMVARLLGPHDVLTPLFGVVTGDQELRFLRLETRGVVHRTVVLCLILTGGVVTGFRVLQGRVALEQLVLISETAHLFGGPGDGPTVGPADAQTSIDTIAQALAPLLSGIRRGEVDIRTLQPRPGDAGRVFRGVDLERIQRTYDGLWQADPPRLSAAADQTELVVHVSTGGALGSGHELSHGFSEHYQSIAPHLVPERTWVAWSFRRPGEERGRRFEGLVWVGDHWAWFPKAWRVVSGG